jgi:hypothetical protein
LRLCLIVACLVVAGCGGDDPPSDDKQIASVLRRTATSADVRVQCETAVSRRFVQEVYGNLEHCRSVNEPDPDDDLSTGARIVETRVDADKATSRMTIVGGALDGVSGRLALVRTNSAWKLDRFGVDFLRSAIEHFPAGTNRDVLKKRACLVRASRSLSTDVLRRAVNALFGERFGDIPDVFFDCLLR